MFGEVTSFNFVSVINQVIKNNDLVNSIISKYY